MAKPVYALVGSDAFMHTLQLRELLTQFSSGAARIDFDGETAQVGEVLDELRSFAMFGGGDKVVVIGSADDFISRYRTTLEEYCAAPVDSATLVLRCRSLPANQRIAKLIAKAGQIIKCEPPSSRDLIPWIVNHGKTAHSVKVTPSAAESLKDLIGDDLGRLDSELSKLALQITGDTIDLPDVRVGVSFAREQEMWFMTDELGAGRVKQAVVRWRQLIQMDSSAEFRAATWFGIWLEKSEKAIAKSAAGLNAFQIATELKIWPADRGAAFIKTANRLGRDQLAKAMDLLVEADYQSKSGVGSAEGNLERFLLWVGAALQ